MFQIAHQGTRRSSVCSKCGKPVSRDNDAVELDYRRGVLSAAAYLTVPSRHLLPTGDCEGSPSRAQYLKGQPRDTRGFGYHPELEGPIRQVFAAMQTAEE